MIKKLAQLTAVYTFIKTLFGYLDPGSGSIIIQILIAAIDGIAGSFALFRHRIMVFLGLRKPLPPDEDEDALAQEETK
jgi:hypothetical protein